MKKYYVLKIYEETGCKIACFFGKNTYLHMYVNYVNINIKLSIITSR